GVRGVHRHTLLGAARRGNFGAGRSTRREPIRYRSARWTGERRQLSERRLLNEGVPMGITRGRLDLRQAPSELAPAFGCGERLKFVEHIAAPVCDRGLRRRL